MIWVEPGVDPELLGVVQLELPSPLSSAFYLYRPPFNSFSRVGSLAFRQACVDLRTYLEQCQEPSTVQGNVSTLQLQPVRPRSFRASNLS